MQAWASLVLLSHLDVITPASDYHIRQIIKLISGGPYTIITKPTAPCKAPYIFLGALQGAQDDLSYADI